jgi:hypothetical protein
LEWLLRAVADLNHQRRLFHSWAKVGLIYSVPISLIARAAAFLASSSEAESSDVTMLRVISPETDRPFGVKLARQTPGFR